MSGRLLESIWKASQDRSSWHKSGQIKLAQDKSGKVMPEQVISNRSSNIYSVDLAATSQVV